MQTDTLKMLQTQLEYTSELNRRATFKTWVFDDQAKCSASKLAEAGFIFVGTKREPDAVKCFLCGKSLDSWDQDDDPWLEHRKHAPYCSFAKMDKPEKAFTLGEYVDVRNELIEKFFQNLLTEMLDEVKEYCEDTVQLLNTLA